MVRDKPWMWIGLLSLSLALSAGCGKKAEVVEDADDAIVPGAAASLARADLEDLQSIDLTGPRKLDRTVRYGFASIFGSNTDASTAYRFYRERIQYEIDLTTTQVQITPEPRYTNWIKHPHNDADSRPSLAAANVSMQFWFQGLIDGRTPTIRVGDTNIYLSSPRRDGFMIFGPGYRKEGRGSLRNQPLPTFFRQAILVHEARHSDCTGGVYDSQVREARNSSDDADFLRRVPELTCGHFHALCPASHPYQGVPACDVEPWGAYAVSFIYSKALSLNPQPERSKHILQVIALDSASRLIGGKRWEDAMAGRYGAPDLSSDEILHYGHPPRER